MTDRPQPTYGTPNWEMLGRWMHLDPRDDGPFWALNLMKYHAVARYADGHDGVSGREADNAYAPLGPLAAVGAAVVFVGEVRDQPLGHPAWDRVAIVRYPTRAAFFAMQERDDFKTQHVHKEAGMEFTIVMSCLPLTHTDGVTPEGSLVIVVGHDGALDPVSGVSEIAHFSVEGVIVGDDRSFAGLRFVRVVDPGALSALVEAVSVTEGTEVLVVGPTIDRLLASLADADQGPEVLA
jgi:hypothetical protein